MSKSIEPRERMDLQAILDKDHGGTASLWSRHRWQRWAAAAVAALVVAFVVWSLRGSTNGVRYVTDPVTRGGLTVVVTATGSVQPTNKVDVSSELSGTVRKVLVDYNSAVTAGELLAELDTDKLKATADSSRAKLAAAKAKVQEMSATVVEREKDLARKRVLTDRRVTSPHDLEAAQAAYDRAVAAVASARADVGVAEADLQLNETNLTKARILSPIGGVVLKRSVDPGQTVAATLQAPVLFSIAEDLKQMELQVDVDEADVGRVRIGQTATFSVDAFPERRFPATIRDVRYASETIQGVVTYKAVLTIDNSELLLRPGMTATAEIKVTEIADTLLIANTGLRYTPAAAPTAPQRSFIRRLMPGPPGFRPASPREETGRNRSIWVLRNGAPVQVRIVIGASDGKRTQVESGPLQAGDAVITDQSAPKS